MAKRIRNLHIVFPPNNLVTIDELDASVTVQALINALAARHVELPSARGHLIRKATNQSIFPQVTLGQAGVHDGEELEFIFERRDVARSSNYYDILRVELPLPYVFAVNEFFGEVPNKVKAIDFIYSLYALLGSGNLNIINEYLAPQNDIREIKLSAYSELAQDSSVGVGSSKPKPINLRRFLSKANIESLRLVSVQYGSSASFDLLGIGKILELVRDTIKDLAWRGKHEKQLAELERKSKQAELQQARLENEKKAIEIANQRLEIERTNMDVALKKVELIEKINDLQLTNKNKQLLASILLPKMITLTKSPIIPVLKSEIQSGLHSGDEHNK